MIKLSLLPGGGKGGWGSGEIETLSRLNNSRSSLYGGKGGWGSGEIETPCHLVLPDCFQMVERVDGAQARLKQYPGRRDCNSGTRVERVDGAQARLKLHCIIRY